MWEALYENFWDRLVHYCARLTRDQTRAEDLAQETFLRAMQHAELLAGLNLRQQKAWLFETAHNLFCDQARRAAREQELLAQLAPGGGRRPGRGGNRRPAEPAGPRSPGPVSTAV